MDLDPVPSTPSEWLPLLEAAEAHDMRVRPFPPKSFLWTLPPDGWGWGTDSWMMTLRPRLRADGVEWVIEYSDDEGRAGYLVTEGAMRLINGEDIWQES